MVRGIRSPYKVGSGALRWSLITIQQGDAGYVEQIICWVGGLTPFPKARWY